MRERSQYDGDMPVRPLPLPLARALAALPLFACLASGPGSFPDAGSYDAGGGPACVPQKVKAACVVQPLDSGKMVGACVEYTGSDYSAATVEKACGSGSLSACPLSGHVGGSCVLNCGQPDETVSYDYDGITVAEVEAACKAQQRATYLPPTP